jgi:hypothetical protein
MAMLHVVDAVCICVPVDTVSLRGPVLVICVLQLWQRVCCCDGAGGKEIECEAGGAERECGRCHAAGGLCFSCIAPCSHFFFSCSRARHVSFFFLDFCLVFVLGSRLGVAVVSGVLAAGDAGVNSCGSSGVTRPCVEVAAGFGPL